VMSRYQRWALLGAMTATSIFMLVSLSRIGVMVGFFQYFLGSLALFWDRITQNNKVLKYIIGGGLGALGMGATGFIIKVINGSRVHQLSKSAAAEDAYYRTFYGIEDITDKASAIAFGNGYLQNKIKLLEYHNNYLGLLQQCGIVSPILYAGIEFGILYVLSLRGKLPALMYLLFMAYGNFHYTIRTRMTWVWVPFIILLLVYLTQKEKKISHAS
jgi:hypothetical protein